MIVECTRYEAGARVNAQPIGLADAARLAREADGFVWVALEDPGVQELDELSRAFGLGGLDLGGSRDGYQRPKLERHGDHTVLTVKTVQPDASGSSFEISPVDLVVSGQYAVAVARSNAEVLERASERLRSEPGVVAHGPMAAVWAVLDAAIGGSERVVDALGDQLERIQIAVFQHDEDQSEPIYLQLRQAERLARAMHPMLTVFDRLERGELVETPRALTSLLSDVSDQARRLSEEVVMLSEAFEGLLNANLARVTVRQNVIIQQVSAWAAIAAVATIITGVYGMNFRHMPELGWVVGYPMAIGIMILTVVALRWYFKRVGWM